MVLEDYHVIHERQIHQTLTFLIDQLPPEMPHKFTNTGTTPLRQLSIHSSKEIITTWLEES